MTTLATARPLATLALPRDGTGRVLGQLALALGGTLLLTLSAKTKVPLGVIDLSMQSFAVLAIAAAFGRRLGVATLLLYMAQGLYGLPVFQGTPERGLGYAYMIGPTGGVLAGFVAMALIVGWAADRGWDRSPARLLGAMLAGEVAMMAMGFAWMATLRDASTAWTLAVAPFVLPDLLKVALAALAVPAVWALVEKVRR